MTTTQRPKQQRERLRERESEGAHTHTSYSTHNGKNTALARVVGGVASF